MINKNSFVRMVWGVYQGPVGGWAVNEYRVEKEGCADYDQIFVVECRLKDGTITGQRYLCRDIEGATKLLDAMKENIIGEVPSINDGRLNSF